MSNFTREDFNNYKLKSNPFRIASLVYSLNISSLFSSARFAVTIKLMVKSIAIEPVIVPTIKGNIVNTSR
jgi:hypothetical protein